MSNQNLRSGDWLDLRELKAEARRLYPPGHPVREVVCQEPDYMKLADSRAKFPVLLRLMFATRREA